VGQEAHVGQKAHATEHNDNVKTHHYRVGITFSCVCFGVNLILGTLGRELREIIMF